MSHTLVIKKKALKNLPFSHIKKKLKKVFYSKVQPWPYKKTGGFSAHSLLLSPKSSNKKSSISGVPQTEKDFYIRTNTKIGSV